MPALLLWGETDAYVPVAAAHRFVEELDDAELVVLEGVGHFLYDDAPSRTGAAVIGFLERRLRDG